VVVLPVSGGVHLVTDTPAYRSDRVFADDIRPATDLPGAVKSLLEELGLASENIAFVGADVAPYAFVRKFAQGLELELLPADDVVRNARRRKSPAELEMLRHAAEIAEIAMAAALDVAQPGVREAEVGAEGARAALANGADFVRYVRVQSGPFSGLPHRWPPASERALVEGDTLCLDLIGAVNGYGFDILRSIVVGEGGDEAKRMVSAARDATAAAIEACGPGVPVRDVTASADRVIEAAGMLEHRVGFIGHGIGVETVEAPMLVDGSDEVLREGDVVCIEPGIVVSNVRGGRFEYGVAITDCGYEVLARG
jgi:Xaa-Pro aminopeptidase